MVEWPIYYKIILLGEPSVGTTSLLQFLTLGKNQDIHPDSNLNYKLKETIINNVIARIQIWDNVARRNGYLSSHCISGADGVCLIFDLCSRESFNKINYWLHMVSNCPRKILIGNKSDLFTQREVKTEEAQRFADSNCISYIETSALVGTNIENILTSLLEKKSRLATFTHEIIQKIKSQDEDESELTKQKKLVSNMNIASSRYACTIL